MKNKNDDKISLSKYLALILTSLVFCSIIVTGVTIFYLLTFTPKLNLLQLALYISIITLFLLGITLLVAYITAKRITNPLVKLYQAFKQTTIVSDIKTFWFTDNTSLTEIYQLGEAANQAQTSIIQIIKSAKEATAVLDEVSSELLDSSGTVNANLEKVANLIEAIQGEMEVQTASAVNIAQIMRKVSSSSQEAANSVTSAKQIAIESAEAAENGQFAVRQTLDFLVQVNNFAGELYQLSFDLNQRSEPIQKILGLLNSISRQTKVLALNANIEAIKASKYGQSFTVVAQEIRSLADNTTFSVDQLNNQIKDINISLNKTTQLISDFYKMVELSGNKVLEAGGKLDEIREKSGENFRFTDKATELTKMQAAYTSEVTRTTQLIAEISEKFATDSESVVSMVKDQVNTVKKVFAAANNIQDTSIRIKQILNGDE